MSKEKLNKKQKDRILKHQNSIIDNFKIENLNHGLVIAHFGEFIELIKTDSNKNILSQEKLDVIFEERLQILFAVILFYGKNLLMMREMVLLKHYLREILCF